MVGFNKDGVKRGKKKISEWEEKVNSGSGPGRGARRMNGIRRHE